MGKQKYLDIDDAAEAGVAEFDREGTAVWDDEDGRRREACVVRLEVMRNKHVGVGFGVMVVVLALSLTQDVRIDDEAWDMVVAGPPKELSEEVFFYQANATAEAVNYLSMGRLAIDYYPLTSASSFAFETDAVFYDAKGDILETSSETQLMSCERLPHQDSCHTIYVPQYPYVWIPSSGRLFGNLTLSRVNTTRFDLDLAVVSMQIYDTPVAVSILVRVVCIGTLVWHFVKYQRSLRLSVDPLRPEHHLWSVLLCVGVIGCNVFFPLALLQRQGGAADEVIAFLVFQLPMIYDHALMGALWGFLVGISKGSGMRSTAAMYSRTVSLTTVFTMLQVAYIATSGTCFAVLRGIREDIVARRDIAWMIEIIYTCCTSVWAIRIFFGIVGCCRGCSMKQQLRNHPYYPSRDRQLLFRLFVIFGVILWTTWAVALVVLRAPQLRLVSSPGMVVLMTLMLHYIVYAGTPAFLEGDDTFPPSPMTDEWKTLRWKQEWLSWAATNPGARCLYVFTTVEEEEKFWSLQRPVQDYRWRQFVPFNYEACAWGLYFAIVSYKVDALSPAVSAVAAVVSIVKSCVEKGSKAPRPSLTVAKELITACETARFSVVRVVAMNGMQVVVGVHDDALIIAFRGSSNIKNWRDDLRFPRVPWDEATRESGHRNLTESYNGYCYTSVPLVHSGFLDVWVALRDVILHIVARHSEGRRLILTGHSLGAAVATLASFTLTLQHPERRVDVFTFGSPLVGNTAFAKVYRSVVKFCFRVVNENDLITRAYLTFNNKHVGTYVALAAANGMLTVDPPFFERLVSPTRILCSSAIAHSITRYKAALMQSFLINSNDSSLYRCLPDW